MAAYLPDFANQAAGTFTVLLGGGDGTFTADNDYAAGAGSGTAILADIVPGLAAEGWTEADPAGEPGRRQYLIIEDRKAAIDRALALARPGDTVAIAGKGHEDVQIIGNRRLPFDDRQAVRDALGRLG